MNLEQAAQRLGCSVKTVRRRINDGELRASHIARGRWLIRDEWLDEYIEAAAARPRDIRPLSAPAAAPIQPGVRPRRRRAGGGDGRLSVSRDMGRAA